MIYFIADTHFGHKNIIKYEDRPFDTVEEMDEYMIVEWNETVNKNDTVYHLGDFALCPTERYINIAHRLNGHKILIRGNHDQQSVTKITERMDFEQVYTPYTIIENKFVLSHKPYWDLNEGQYNIHGHKHRLSYIGSESYKSDRHFCVSVENIDYTPVSLNNIKHSFCFK